MVGDVRSIRIAAGLCTPLSCFGLFMWRALPRIWLELCDHLITLGQGWMKGYSGSVCGEEDTFTYTRVNIKVEPAGVTPAACGVGELILRAAVGDQWVGEFTVSGLPVLIPFTGKCPSWKTADRPLNARSCVLNELLRSASECLLFSKAEWINNVARARMGWIIRDINDVGNINTGKTHTTTTIVYMYIHTLIYV